MASSNLNKKDLFSQIDTFFQNKKPSEVSMFYLIAALLIGYLVYEFVYSQTDEKLTQTQNRIVQIKQKLNTEQNYLAQNSPAKLASLQRLVKSKKQAFDDTLYKISYVDNTLTELSYLLFDDENWAKFVDNIAALAKKYHVDIKEIGNKFYNPTFQKITHVVEIDVVSRAKFTNMMKFVNALEESPLVIDINDIKMSKPDDKLLGSFKIAVWGMKY
jgi:Tfp pilus assembly protein PilO